MDIAGGEEKPCQKRAPFGAVRCRGQPAVAVAQVQQDGGSFEHDPVGRLEGRDQAQGMQGAVGRGMQRPARAVDLLGLIGQGQLFQHKADDQRGGLSAE